MCAQAIAVRIWRLPKRYGWRTPFVVVAIFWGRWNISGLWRIGWLKLLTSGPKGRGIKLGPGISINAGALLSIGDLVVWEGPSTVRVNTSGKAVVKLGSNLWLSQGLQLYASNSIVIGDEVIIGESVSMRDSTHRFDRLDIPMQSQGDVYGSILIEELLRRL